MRIAQDVALRPEMQADQPFALALYVEQRTPELAAVSWPPEGKLRFLADQFALQEVHYRAHHPGAERWIVERAGTAIGRLYVQPARHWWGLMEICLLTAARGCGTGTALVGWTIEAAGAEEAGVELQVLIDNAGAIALYRRLGFVEAPPHRDSRLRMRRPYGA